MSKVNTTRGLHENDLKLLVRQKIAVIKCNCCDINGQQYWDGATGEGCNNSPMGIDPEWLTSGDCEDCNGIGFVLFYTE